MFIQQEQSDGKQQYFLPKLSKKQQALADY
jgi:hypothetical protein